MVHEADTSRATDGQERRERFAEELRRLRVEAGNPSFRAMASKSRSVSHATLHEAAKGIRFPSWVTTQAFVEACGGDVAQWRERWSAVLDETLRPEEEITGKEITETESGGDRDVERRRSRRGRPIALAAVCAVLAVAGTVLFLAVPLGGHSKVKVEAVSPSPEPTTPRIPGDMSQFVADVTIPDGTVVHLGERFVKTWEILNSGTAEWHGRYLARGAFPADNGTCETPAKVPIPDTAPGKHVRVSVPVTAPSTAGSCWVGWKMVDGEGTAFLPGARPVYFVVNVRG